MGISKTAIYSSAVIFALFMSIPAQAQNKGASAAAPGQLFTKPPTGTTAGRDFAPGQVFKKDDTLSNAKTSAPGFDNPNKALAPGQLKPLSK